MGGSYGFGTVFKLTTNGLLTTLASFAQTNGASPYHSELVQSIDGCLYGTTVLGGDIFGAGTVFKVTTNGVLTMLTSTGGYPAGGLAQGADGNLYGTSQAGGDSGNGEVFRVTTQGSFTRVASFEGTNGGHPYAKMIIGKDGAFYGTTIEGGNGWLGAAGSGYGTVFRVTTNGNLTMLASFSVGGTEGFAPSSGLTLGRDRNLYGTTESGGAYGNGVVFRLNMAPGISIRTIGQLGPTNGIVLLVTGLTGQGEVILQGSSNLVEWSAVQTNPPVTGSLSFQDDFSTTQSVRFYRILEQ